MIAELIIPIETLRGQLRKDGYYFRMYRGKQIVQRCPNRSGHIKTESEKANQERFAEQYGRKKPASDVNGRRRARLPGGTIDEKRLGPDVPST